MGQRELAERMHDLFRGCEHGSGTHGAEKRLPGKTKTEIKTTARTVREPASPDLWLQHLEGTRALGVIPIMATGRCWWGVIDIDEYALSHRDLATQLDRMQLPLLVCRSKSGGAHLFAFFAEPIDAAEVIAKLNEIAAAMGHAGCEIFPKQTELKIEKGDLGNWLNMPYYAADRGGTRYAVDKNGMGLSLQQFIEQAELSRMSEDIFLSLEPRMPHEVEEDDLDEGPPCLQHLAAIRVREGHRNNAMFEFATFAKKKFPDGWIEKVEQFNQRYLESPLSRDEVEGIIRGHKTKDYNYRCGEQPIKAHCDSLACRGRKFGVGEGPVPDIAAISVLDTEPPLYFVSLKQGGTVEVTPQEILSSRAFQLAVLQQLKVLVYSLYKDSTWQTEIRKHLAAATLIEVPKEAGIRGAFLGHLQTFATDRHAAQTIDDTMNGKPFHAEDEGSYYFKLESLMEFLDSHKFREYSRPKVVARLKELGATSHFFKFKGKGVNLWCVPQSVFSVQTEPFDLPRMDRPPI